MSKILDPRKAFEKKLVEIGERKKKVLALSCDSVAGGGLNSFFNTFPERSIEIGISEQNAVGISAAMSKMGFIPVLVIINPFLTMRAFEQIRDDLGYADSNVKIVGSGGGLAYSTLGATHIAIEDVAIMRTVPNLIIFAPGNADEVEFYLEEAIKINGPVYIRMPRQARPLPRPLEERRMEVGKAESLYEGKDIAIFTYGPSVEEAMKARALLARDGVDAAIVNFTTIKPFDEETALKYSRSVKLIATLEEHIVTGGLGSAVAEALSNNNASVDFKMFAIPLGSTNTGPYDELVDFYGLSGEKVAESILRLYKEKVREKID